MVTVTENYTLGRGVVHIDVWENNAPTGAFRDIGNAPLFNFSQTANKIDHFSSRQGLRVKDASVYTEITMNGKIEIDNISGDNLALWLSGDSEIETQVATGGGSPLTETITAKKGRWFHLGTATFPAGLRNLANFTIARENSAFNEVTAVSAAGAGSGLTDGTRTFTVADGTGTTAAVFSFTVSGGSITGAATIIEAGRYSVNPDTTANATCTVDSGVLGGATFNLTMGAKADATLSTDQYEFDGTQGRVYLAADADEFDDGDTLNLGYKKLGATRETVEASGVPLTVSIMFLSDNGNGVNRNYFFPKCTIQADGDFAAIGEEFQKMSFSFEALEKDTATARAYMDGNPILL